jgi:hypothetical protein
VSLAISSYAALGLFIWATRVTVAFPWASVVRVLALVAVASIAGGLLALAVPTLVGLFVSGVVYLAVVAGLVFVVDRPVAERAIGLLSRLRS